MSYRIENITHGTTRTWRGPIFGPVAKPAGEARR